MEAGLKLLHSSDLHLGMSISSIKRNLDLDYFLDWFYGQILNLKPDLLILSGDIFDSSAPPISAQAAYYKFLTKLSLLHLSTVIIAGNHDSPSFLSAPSSLLREIGIKVIGAPPSDLSDLIFPVYRKEKLLGVVASVPFLRVRDLPSSPLNLTHEEKEKQLIESISDYYKNVAKLVSDKFDLSNIPLIFTGHLHLQSGSFAKLLSGERNLYVGMLGALPIEMLPAADYFALGHIHHAGAVGAEYVRYSGAPVVMRFDDGERISENETQSSLQPSVTYVEFEGKTPHIFEIPVPQRSALVRISGSPEFIEGRLGDFVHLEKKIYLDLESTQPISNDYRARIAEKFEGSSVQIAKIRTPLPNWVSIMEAAEEMKVMESSPTALFKQILERNRKQYEIDSELESYFLKIHEEILQSIEDEAQE